MNTIALAGFCRHRGERYCLSVNQSTSVHYLLWNQSRKLCKLLRKFTPQKSTSIQVTKIYRLL